MIKVFLADDHEMMVQGLARFLNEADDFEVVGTATSGDETLERIKELHPDVAVLDLAMPDGSGSEITPQIVEEGIRVLFLSGLDDPKTIYDAIATGASGYVTKTKSWGDLAVAIRKVAEGDSIISSEVLNALTDEMHRRSTDNALTPRECDVLELLAQGSTVPQTAQSLYLSTDTVKGYLKQIYGKLHVHTQAAAVAEGIKRKIIK